MANRVIAGRYRLDQLLGTGAMSEVWAAKDVELDRTVAVKLRAAGADAERFDREAHAVAALSHPNVCALYDYGSANGQRFMVLEYLPGGSLDDRLQAGRPLPDDETERVAREVAAGLAHAHARDVVHRDLKPANILFDGRGSAKIADFGIARMGDASGLTAAGTVLGTAAYISPEQVAGQEATPASDVYSFGVILFRMLTGRLPFESPDAMALAAMHRDLVPPSVLEFRPDAPARLETVATAALAKSPADRPRDGLALVEQLGHPQTAPPETAVTEIVAAPRRGRRTRIVLIAAAALVAAAGVGLATAVTLGNGTTPIPPSTSTGATTRPATSATTGPTTTAESTESTESTTTAPPTTTTAPTTAPVTVPTSTAVPTTTPPTTAPATTAVPPPTFTAPTTTTEPATTTATTAAATTETTAATTTTPTTTAALQETTTTAPG